MKPLTTAIFVASTAFALFFLSSCSKDIRFQEPPEVVNACRIDAFKISTLEGIPTSSTLSISYNTKGDPAEIITTGAAVNSLYDYHFRYDHYGRLTDFIISFSGELGAVIWHRYSYPDRKTIVDTSYDYVGLIAGPPPTSSFDTYVDVCHLDDQDRIISDNDIHFQYDRNGNLVRSGVTYDKKVNLNRTNSVWMLISRDFSRNNPLNGIPNALTPWQITGYNFFGLPLRYTVTPGNSGAILENGILFSFDDLQVVYSCGGSGKK